MRPTIPRLLFSAGARYNLRRMKVCFLVLGLFAAFANCAFAAPAAMPAKKGFGLGERHGFGAGHLQQLRVGWFYNWGTETTAQTSVPFVPMVFSEKKLKTKISGNFVLGFNEPDNEKQANLSAKEALAHWPTIAAKARVVGGPAMAGNPLKSEWLEEFMKARPKVDFITVHWYKGADSRHFIKDLTEIHAKFGKPIWVTEFAPQTAASSKADPEKFSPAQVAQFVAETTRWMDMTPWVQRYAWHDSRVGTSALFDADGKLTVAGKAYAAAGAAVAK